MLHRWRRGGVAPPENFAVKRLTMKKTILESGYKMGLESGLQHLAYRSMRVNERKRPILTLSLVYSRVTWV